MYNTALTAAIKHFSFAKEMKLANKAFESDRSIVSDINIKHISNYEHKITKTTIQRYYKKAGISRREKVLLLRSPKF